MSKASEISKRRRLVILRSLLFHLMSSNRSNAVYFFIVQSAAVLSRVQYRFIFKVSMNLMVHDLLQNLRQRTDQCYGTIVRGGT